MSEDPITLRVPLGTENGIFWNTGDEHDEMGHITEDPETRISMMEKRLSKLELIQNRIPKEEQITIEFENNTSSNVKRLMVIVSWGSTKGAILDSLEKITESDDTTQFLYLQIKLLNPFPGKLLEDIVNNKIEKLNS